MHDFDKATFFEGCLPIEVMAHRGRDTLRFGPMKPVGLADPRTGRVPYAVVQLRQDTLAGDHFSLVGFQTQIKWGDQARVLRMIPGLEQAEFVRFGMVHRNTYICGPKVLLPTWQTRARADLFFAGQVSGVEGYVESAASGLIAGRNAARLAHGAAPLAPPRTTAIGALAYYVSHADPAHYQPTNITHGIMPPLENPPRDKMQKKMLIAEARARRSRGVAGRRRRGLPKRRHDAVRDHLKAFLAYLAPQSSRLRPHGSRLRHRHHALPRLARGRTRAQDVRARAVGPRSALGARRIWPISTAPAARDRRWRAGSRRFARSRSTCGAKS